MRADLFRALGGFDPAITFHGDDIDLCWRVHLLGARTVIVPRRGPAIARSSRSGVRTCTTTCSAPATGMRTVVTLTGGTRLPVRSVEMVLLTGAELVIGAFTGRLSEAWSSVRGLLGLIPRTPALLARRGAIAKTRHVGDDEILDLQNRGSALADVVPPGSRHRDVHRRRNQRQALAGELAGGHGDVDPPARGDPPGQPDVDRRPSAGRR